MAEAQWFLLVRRCMSCGKGPLRMTRHRTAREGERIVDRMETACGACGEANPLVFDVSGAHDLQVEGSDVVVRINETDEPSRVIDVAGWLALFAATADAAGREADKSESRRLGFEAAQCLEEALRFYETDNDLPPEWSFFTEESRARARQHPQQYNRQRLLELRGKLPSLAVMEDRITRQPARKRWWRLWGKR